MRENNHDNVLVMSFGLYEIRNYQLCESAIHRLWYIEIYSIPTRCNSLICHQVKIVEGRSNNKTLVQHPSKYIPCIFRMWVLWVWWYSLRKKENQTVEYQTLLMRFIKVVLEAFLSPNDLMLKAPSSRGADRWSKVINRPKAHTTRILVQRGQTWGELSLVLKLKCLIVMI